MTGKHEWSYRAVEFIGSIGLNVCCAEVRDSHIPFVKISDGGLVVDVKNVFPGDVLHEAGHLAVIPQPFRDGANDDLADVNRHMGRHLDIFGLRGFSSHPEDPLCRALLQCGEHEAIAWQYAAACAIDLPEEWLFPPDSFGGEGAALAAALKGGWHAGIHGLRAAGWTKLRARDGAPAGAPVYPQLAFWLHPGAKQTHGATAETC